MIADPHSLAIEFFHVLGRALYPAKNDEISKSKRAGFYRYVARALAISSKGTSAVGVLMPGAEIVAGTLRKFGELVDDTASGLEHLSAEPTLSELRDEIVEALRTREKPIIVVIDDIDRLDATETRTLLQVLKACADFPGVRYLLLYDRAQVIHALSGATVNDPEAFLEKIVNVAFDLPEATSMQRRTILAKLVNALPFPQLSDEDSLGRVHRVCGDVLLPGLPTVRSLNRFFSSIAHIVPGIIVGGFSNVDPGDFLALEFIRQYSPTTYTFIRGHDPWDSAGKAGIMTSSKDWFEIAMSVPESMVSELKPPLKDVVKSAISCLSFRKQMFGDRVGHAQKRFATPYWRPVYLGFSAARATVSEDKWQDFRSKFDDLDYIRILLDSWSDIEMRDRWVTAISVRAEELDVSNAHNFLRMLFRWGEKRKSELSIFKSRYLPWEHAIDTIVSSLMKARLLKKKTTEVFMQSLVQSEAIVGPAYVVGLEKSRLESEYNTEWLTRDQIVNTVEYLCPKLSAIIKSDQIWSLPDPETAIVAWNYLVGPETFRSWFYSIPQNIASFVSYIDRVLGPQVEREPFVNWSWEQDDFVIGAEKLNPALLTDLGRRARNRLIESARAHRALSRNQI